MTFSEQYIEYYRKYKCEEKGCWNLQEDGYIYCVHHLHGFPSRIPDEIIAILKKEMEKEAST